MERCGSQFPVARDVWNRLERQVNANLFCSYEYLRVLVTHSPFPEALEPLFLVGRNDTEVSGVAALKILNERLPKVGVQRIVTFVGHYLYHSEPRLLVPTSELSNLLAGLRAQCETFDGVWLGEQTAPFARTLHEAALHHGFHCAVFPSLCAYKLDVSGNWDKHMMGYSGRAKRKLRAAQRKLEEVGSIEWESTFDWNPSLLDRYLALEGYSSEKKQRVGIRGRGPQVVSFYRALLASLAKQGRVLFDFLTVNRRDVAAAIGVIHRRVYYALETCFDESLKACRPGVVRGLAALEHMFANHDVDLVDFLAAPSKVAGLRKALHVQETPTTGVLLLNPHSELSVLCQEIAAAREPFESRESREKACHKFNAAQLGGALFDESTQFSWAK